MKNRRQEETDSFSMRAARFLSDPLAETLTGVRRSGREATMLRLRDIALEQGYSVAVYPDVPKKVQIIFFLDWVGNDSAMDEMHRTYPDATIIFGQDLCHQVPAAVRYRPSR